jgi:hypothetical protein
MLTCGDPDHFVMITDGLGPKTKSLTQIGLY